MKRLIGLGIAAVLAFAAFASPAFAQSSGQVQVVGPLTRDLGAVQTFTAQGAATVNSADQSGFNVSRVVCVFRQSTFTGTPSVTFKIQNKDAKSGQYYDLITSSAITTSTSPSAISAGAGLTTAANVSNGNLPIAAKWRTSTVFATGTGTPLVTGTVGCSVQ